MGVQDLVTKQIAFIFIIVTSIDFNSIYRLKTFADFIQYNIFPKITLAIKFWMVCRFLYCIST